MKLSDFDFELPQVQIARYPTDRRDGARMLVVRRAEQTVEHAAFTDLPALLQPNDLVVVNDTKVLRARFVTKKQRTGGKVELLLVRSVEEDRTWICMLNAAKKVRPGQVLELVADPSVTFTVAEILGEGFAKVVLPSDASQLAARFGELPLPPYLERGPDASDLDRYQTIFARAAADRSVAAPTAGLHFTKEVLKRLAQRSIEHARVTLHVGPGTFLPVRTERIEEHRMHSEQFEIDAVAAVALRRTEALKGRVVAVGSTVTRVLETVGRPVHATSGSTDIFIRPGYEFRGVDVMLTNFHLPKSTLLMLVCAFAGYDLTMEAYRIAVSEDYRFFSYGDAMLIL